MLCLTSLSFCYVMMNDNLVAKTSLSLCYVMMNDNLVVVKDNDNLVGQHTRWPTGNLPSGRSPMMDRRTTSGKPGRQMALTRMFGNG